MEGEGEEEDPQNHHHQLIITMKQVAKISKILRPLTIIHAHFTRHNRSLCCLSLSSSTVPWHAFS